VISGMVTDCLTWSTSKKTSRNMPIMRTRVENKKKAHIHRSFFNLKLKKRQIKSLQLLQALQRESVKSNS